MCQILSRTYQRIRDFFLGMVRGCLNYIFDIDATFDRAFDRGPIQRS